jgi:hypothetical protein
MAYKVPLIQFRTPATKKQKNYAKISKFSC